MYYILVTLLNKEKNTMYHYVSRKGNYDNLLTFKDVKHIYAINIYRKQLAYDIAESLNNEMKKQNRLMDYSEMYID